MWANNIGKGPLLLTPYLGFKASTMTKTNMCLVHLLNLLEAKNLKNWKICVGCNDWPTRIIQFKDDYDRKSLRWHSYTEF